MTRDANRKSLTRAAAATAGRNYTTVLRDRPGAVKGAKGLKALLDLAGQLDPAWEHLITTLAEARAQLAVRLAAYHAADAAVVQITAVCGRVVPANLAVALGEARTRLDTEAESARQFYVALAGHALAVAAGEAQIFLDLPDYDRPCVEGPATTIPRSLASYTLADLRAAVPDVAAADRAQEQFEQEFGAEFSDGADAAMADLEDLYVRLDRQSVLWADAVCTALCGELRLLLE